MRTKRTRAQIAARARARKIMRDPLYQEYRGWHFGLGAWAALKAVRKYDALLIAIENTPAAKRRRCEAETEERAAR